MINTTHMNANTVQLLTTIVRTKDPRDLSSCIAKCREEINESSSQEIVNHFHRLAKAIEHIGVVLHGQEFEKAMNTQRFVYND